MNSIHDFERKLELLQSKIRAADMCQSNKDLLLEFGNFCTLEGLSLARRWKLVEYMHVFCTRFLRKPFRRATSQDILDAVLKIEASHYAPWTKHDFKVAVRKFFKFAEWGKSALHRTDYPESVAGISIRIKKKDQVRIQAGDILTPDECQQLIASTSDTQHKALISLLYELGLRVGEAGTMRIGSVNRDQHGFMCDVNGKTGPRSSLAISSASALTAWLNQHPEADQSGAPLWGVVRKGCWHRTSYGSIQRLVKQLAMKAGIKKRVYPHLLRHSRITHLLAAGRMNEAQAKTYFGLSGDSKILATYSHLVSKDANDAVLRMHGITSPKNESLSSSQKCGMCGDWNEQTTRFCSRCGYALDSSAAKEAASENLKRISRESDRVLQYLQRPGVNRDFRRWIQDQIRGEVEKLVADALLRQSSPPREPIRERRSA